MNKNHPLANQVIDRCLSTNDLAKTLAEQGCPHGTWVAARHQETGRGRLGRKWESAEGNLFLSLVIQSQGKIENQSLLSWIPLASAVAVTRALKKQFSGIHFQIKWPNDLYLAGKKLGGILCEGFRVQSETFIVIGVGLNCLQSPEGLDQQTIDLTTAVGRGPIRADDIRDLVLKALLSEVQVLMTEGTTEIRKSYECWATLTKGTEIEWGNPIQTGWVETLGPSGELLVISNSNGANSNSPNAKKMSLFCEDVQVRLKKEAPKDLKDPEAS